MASKRRRRGRARRSAHTREESFHLIKVAAYTTIAAIFGGSAALQSSAFLSMWSLPSQASEIPEFVARIILFILLVALSISWIAATESELQLWIEWLDTPIVRSEFEVYAAMFGLAVILGLMFVFVYNIVLISGFISFYLLFNYWAQWLANDRFAKFLKKTKSGEPDEERQRVLVVMEHYWLELPQLGL